MGNIVFRMRHEELPRSTEHPATKEVICEFDDPVENVHVCMQGWNLKVDDPNGNVMMRDARVEISDAELKEGNKYAVTVTYCIKHDETAYGFSGNVRILFIAEKHSN